MKAPPRPGVALVLAAVFASSLVLAGCHNTDPLETAPELGIHLVARYPHNRDAFTEGLDIDGPIRYESTGLRGHSSLTATDRVTGRLLAHTQLDPAVFGEGIAATPATLWQLTWTEGIAFARDPHTLAELRRVPYEGEGWGLCWSGTEEPVKSPVRDRLVMSNGTSTLTFRNPTTFAVTGSVTLPTAVRLNELDCSPDGTVWANAWPTDRILHIDPANGSILAAVMASHLLTPTERAGAAELNGIAHIPGSDHFLITGKNWPTLFEVQWTPSTR